MGQEKFRSGFVAIVGRPNSGKSTLLNRLAGEKVAIVSDKPQTTRMQIRGVANLPNAQIVLVDTPGLHKPKDVLGDQLNQTALEALRDVDAVVVLVDAYAGIGTGDRWVSEAALKSKGSSFLLLNKIDLVPADRTGELEVQARELGDFYYIAAVSALTGYGVPEFVERLVETLPQGPKYYPDDQPTDQPLTLRVAEVIREKTLERTREEVPHSVGVLVNEISERKDKNLTDIDATIFVERESQKGIVVGRKAQMLKAIGMAARHELESMLGTRVFLHLTVKCKKNWRKDLSYIKRMGYMA